MIQDKEEFSHDVMGTFIDFDNKELMDELHIHMNTDIEFLIKFETAY